jgi:hypothetical protein
MLREAHAPQNGDDALLDRRGVLLFVGEPDSMFKDFI